MRPGKLLEGIQQRQPIDRALHGRSSIAGAMVWMFALSLIIAFALGWVPVIGPFVGPVVGGYMGGRRAGTIVRALLAAILPAAMLSSLILIIGALAAALSEQPVVGAVAVVVAGALSLILILHNLLLFAAAFIGGLVRQLETDM